MNKNIFKASIVSAARYRRLRKYRYGLYMTLLFYVSAIITPPTRTGKTANFIQTFNVDLEWYFSILAVLVVITFALYYYSTRHEILGELKVYLSTLQITKNGEVEFYPFKDLRNIVIERGSTYHYEYRERNYIIKTDNWIHFIHNGQQRKIEFKLDSIWHNQQFEEMISNLGGKGFQLEYLSI